jgi:general secretion pathway protein H
MNAARGFSLIEVLVAVAIVALMAAAVVLSVGSAGAGRTAEREAQRLAQLVEHACERASLTGRPHGLHVSLDRYSFSVWDGTRFVFVNRDELRQRQLPDGMRFELGAVGSGLDLGERFAEKPQVVCWPSGELTPFTLDIAVTPRQPLYRVDAAVDGSFTVAQVATP